MERVFLCLLCLSGWSISSCLPRHYHYVNDPMTWTEAQTYCREKYTDLATVENIKEMDQLKSSVPSHYRSSFVWIGLYSKIQWKWSDGYNRSESDYTNWQKRKEPDFSNSAQLCVQPDDKGEWWDGGCSSQWSSICYRGTAQDPEFVFVSETKHWFDAQRYCRENYVDLATIKSDADNQKVRSLVPKGDYPWVGLHRDPNMFWSDGSRFLFQFWGQGSNPLGSMSVVCKAADLSNAGRWRPKSCEEKYPFVCYSTGSKQVIKLKMKPDDPSVDLNNPAVKAGLLRELQDQLKKSGLSGVTLELREQPDGNVFHKKEENSREREECDYIVRDEDMD